MGGNFRQEGGNVLLIMRIQAPLLYSVDVVVFGATTAAVTAALAAREAGASVLAISDRPFFGEESAASLAFIGAPLPVDPLLRPIWETALDPAGFRAGAIKHGLEKALLAQEIPFLFMARPVALLPGGDGQPAGLVFAARTSLYAVKARTFVDASRTGLLGILAGQAPVSITGAALNVLATGRTEANPLEGATPFGNEFSIANTASSHPVKGDMPPVSVRAHRLRHEGPAPGAGLPALAAFEHQVRATVLDASVLHTAEALELDTAPAPTAGLPGNFVSVAGIAPQPDLHASLGREAGARAAALARSVPEPRLQPAAAGGEERFGFATPFYRQAQGWVEADLPALPVVGRFDVVVAGGGTAGAPAGIAAARAGATTVVLETQGDLGGVGTLGTIACYYFGNLVGFTHEIDSALAHLDPDQRPGRWNPALKGSWYSRALREAGGQAWFGSFAFGVRKEGSRVEGILVSTPFGSGLIEAGAVIDASGSADVAAAAGARCRVIGANHVATQGAGLSPRRPGDHYINSDFTFIDDNDVAGVTHVFVQARARFSSDFDTIPFLNTRERRQIEGEVELSPLDFLTRRQFPDTITTAISNFDTHGYTIHPVFTVTPPDHDALAANVPYRCLLPRGVDGVLVTGLGMSAHRDAIPVVRMQGDVQNQGYAAGYAAFLAASGAGDLRRIPMGTLQRHLLAKGILAPEVVGCSERPPFSAEAIREAARHTPVDFYHTALLMEHPQESIVALREVLAAPCSELQREEAALILGLLGDAEAAPVLAEIVAARDWDAGWNYRGMGQFGMSCSRVDALVIALGATHSPLGEEPVLAKIAALGPDSEFSHCRAVAVAAAHLNTPALANALAAVLAKPTYQGHSVTRTAEAIANEPPTNPGAKRNDNFLRTETTPRTLSLRELHLAKALYLCGDRDGLGRAILERYRDDVRGLYARHARAILEAEDLDALRRETI